MGALSHYVDHAAVGVCLLKAGAALDKRVRLGWLLGTLAFFVRCHDYHHAHPRG